ncbi:hypothetical protein HMPREF1981_02441 [Bacteroides pyogenes F0041]|uniref:Uncharacterized protein n=1 Tax=Bacteroides pyogenes F0041 TaxID=1321819 RepID=U2CIG5_9BACE|nr:hypothetical protein HMPREF1981_02441 [Bacteroides pyogenes F0041]
MPSVCLYEINIGRKVAEQAHGSKEIEGMSKPKHSEDELLI